MTATNITRLASRPVYRGLASHGPVPSLMVADARGAEALLRLAASDPLVMPQAHVIYLPLGSDLGSRLKSLEPASYIEAVSYPAILSRLRKLLAEASMSTRLYLAGTEGLIGQVTAEALDVGLQPDAIETEHLGSAARRMHCVHCKGVTENVTIDPFVCSHCGLTLFVRDHYSRRLAAFQGVCVDAETPGVIPEAKEIKACEG